MVTSARMSRSISQVPSIRSLEHARDTATCSWKKIPPTSLPEVYDYVTLYMCPTRGCRPTHVSPFESHIFSLGFHPAPLYLTRPRARRKSITKIRRVPTFYILFFYSFLIFFPANPRRCVNLKKINHRLSKPPKML